MSEDKYCVECRRGKGSVLVRYQDVYGTSHNQIVNYQTIALDADNEYVVFDWSKMTNACYNVLGYANCEVFIDGKYESNRLVPVLSKVEIIIDASKIFNGIAKICKPTDNVKPIAKKNKKPSS